MFKFKRNILAAVIFFLITSLYGQATRVLLNSGHNGPINTLAFQQKYELLFSCGSDGTVRAWDTKTKSLVFLLQVSHLPVRMISLNPDKPQVAVVESDGLQIFRLSLWDWQQKKRLYTINLSEIPLFLRFSPQGNLLVYGKADWNGIIFLDAQEGTALPLLQEGTGIVSDVFISSTENSLLSYSPSGSIKYWDLRTRTKRAEFSTLSNLNSIGFSADGRYMTGLYEGKLVVIDLVTGRSIDQREIQNPILAKVNPITGDILCLSGGRNPVLTLWTLSQGRLSPNTTNLKPPGGISVNTILYAQGTAFVASMNGEVFFQNSLMQEPALFSSNKILEISDIAIGDNTLLLASRDSLITCNSDFFETRNSQQIPSYFFTEINPNPYTRLISLKHWKENLFFLWPAELENSSLSLFHARERVIQPLWEYTGILRDLKTRGNNILTLDRNGTIQLRTYPDPNPYFSLTISGLRDVGFAGSNLLAAGNSATIFETPLLHINPSTLETSPIADSNMLTNKLIFDEHNNTLYTLGFERRQDSLITVLKSHTGGSLERSRARISYYGEDYSADMVLDRETGTLFTTLGFSGARMLSWSGFTNLEATDHIPRRLMVQGFWVYSLNSDGSISIWDKRSGKRILDFYMFKDLEWVALFSNGEFYASPGGHNYVTVFNEEALHLEEKSRYQRRIY